MTSTGEVSNCSKSASNSNDDDSSSFNGQTTDKYSWSQAIIDLEVKIKVEPEIQKGKQVKVEIGTEDLKVQLIRDLKNPNDIEDVVVGKLTWPIIKDDSYWNLTPGKYISIFIQKKQERWWTALLEGEANIDLKNIEAVHDMSEQMKIQKMMYNQQQKQKALPTSDEPSEGIVKMIHMIPIDQGDGTTSYVLLNLNDKEGGEPSMQLMETDPIPGVLASQSDQDATTHMVVDTSATNLRDIVVAAAGQLQRPPETEPVNVSEVHHQQQQQQQEFIPTNADHMDPNITVQHMQPDAKEIQQQILVEKNTNTEEIYAALQSQNVGEITEGIYLAEVVTDETGQIYYLVDQPAVTNVIDPSYFHQESTQQ